MAGARDSIWWRQYQNDWRNDWSWWQTSGAGGWSWSGHDWGNRSWGSGGEETEDVRRQPSWENVDVGQSLATRQPTRQLATLAEGGEDEADDAAGPPKDAGDVKQEPAEPVVAKAANDVEHEAWRCDKYGSPLKPQALYMRFYRGLRSKRDPPPEEIQQQIKESEKDKGGSKLHALYEQYLACQGNWRDCVLLIEVSKRNRLKQDEIYTWLRFTEMEAKYGSDLALDLKSRLLEQESKLDKARKGKYVRRHPDFPDNESMNLYRCFLSMNEIKEKENESRATLAMQAELEVESAMDGVCPALLHGKGSSLGSCILNRSRGDSKLYTYIYPIRCSPHVEKHLTSQPPKPCMY